VVVVPAVGADLVGLAAGADAGEFGEELLAGVGEGEDADGAGTGEQVDGVFGAVGEGDGALFDEGGLLDTFLVALAVGAGALGGGDLVDGAQAEGAEQPLVVDAAESAVLVDALEPRSIGGDAGDGVESGGGFASGGGDPVGAEDDSSVAVGGAHGDEHELEAPGGLAGALEVQASVGFEPWGRSSPVVGACGMQRCSGGGPG
jgi:hypothetical protein